MVMTRESMQAERQERDESPRRNPFADVRIEETPDNGRIDETFARSSVREPDLE